MRYYYLSRPPGIGCQPDGWVKREAFSSPRVPRIYDRTVHGWVDYEDPLGYYMIWKYDLMPADWVERAKFHIAYKFVDFGQGQGRNQQQVDRMVGKIIQKYVDTYGKEDLSTRSYYAGDYILKLVCLVIREGGWSGTN